MPRKDREKKKVELETEESVQGMATAIARYAFASATLNFTGKINLDEVSRATKKLVPYLLFITDVAPASPFVKQPTTIKFTLINLTGAAVSGRVETDFGSQFQVQQLGARASLEASVVFTPTKVGRNQELNLVFKLDGKDEILAADGAQLDVRTGYILEVADTFQNPSPPDGAAWNSDVCHNHSLFDGGHLLDDNNLEWAPILPQFDGDEIGADVAVSGFVCEDHFSGDDDDFSRDIPFTHPFHNDWEMIVAPDEPYLLLLAPTQITPDPAGEFVRAQTFADRLQIPNPKGFLGVEIQRGLLGLHSPDDDFADPNADLPPEYQHQPYRARQGDRVAMLGRWIADCGHAPFTTEIHEPLLHTLARAVGPTTTHLELIGRPYFVSQKFDGHSLTNAMIVRFGERLAEAHGYLLLPFLLALVDPVQLRPEIIAKPFRGKKTFPVIVRPPIPRPSDHSILRVSYHFTVRSGVTVSVSPTSNPDEVVLLVEMDDAAYPPAAAVQPKNVHVPWDGTPNSLLAGQKQADKAGLYALIEISGLLDSLVRLVWQKGFETDRYDIPPPGSPHDSENVVSHGWVTPTGIATKNSGFSKDDDQAYPIYGWLNLDWIDLKAIAPKYQNLENVASKLETRGFDKNPIIQKLDSGTDEETDTGKRPSRKTR